MTTGPDCRPRGLAKPLQWSGRMVRGSYCRQRLSVWLLGTTLQTLLGNSGWAYPPIGAEQSQRFLNQAITALREKSAAEAETLLKKSLATNPRNLRALKLYATFLLKQRRLGQAEAVLSRGLQHNRGSPQIRAYLAVTYCWQGHTGKALSTFGRIEASVRRDGAMVFLISECLLHNAKYPLAAQWLKEALARPTRLGPALRARYATALLETGNLREAQAQIERLKRSHRTNPRVIALRARLALEQKSCGTAKRLYEELTRGEPDAHLLDRARVALCRGQRSSALALLQRFVRRAGKRTERTATGGSSPHEQRRLALAFELRGDLLRRRGQHASAAAAYAASLSFRDRSNVRLRLVRAYLQTKSYAKATRVLAPVVDRPTQDRAALALAVRVALRTQRKQDALAYAARLRRCPSLTPADDYLVGVALKAGGRFSAAASMLSRAVKRRPAETGYQADLGQTHLLLARNAARAGRYDSAIRHVRTAARLPAYQSLAGPLAANLGLLYLRKGSARKALSLAEKAASVEANNWRAQWVAARAAQALGKEPVADRWYSKTASGLLGQPRSPKREAILVAIVDYFRSRGRFETCAKLLRSADALPATRPARAALARLYFARGRTALREGLIRRGKQDFARCKQLLGSLGTNAARKMLGQMILTLVEFGAASFAAELFEQGANGLEQVLHPALVKDGLALFRALLASTSAVRGTLNAASRLAHQARLSTTPPPQADLLSRISLALLHRRALRHFGSQPRHARRLLRKAATIQRFPSVEIRHNLALVELDDGARARALRDLRGIATELPLALCNLAAWAHNGGEHSRSYALLLQCDNHGVSAYPGLKRILNAKRQLFGLE